MVKLKKQSFEYKQIVYLALITGLCLMGDSMLYVALPLYWGEVGLTSPLLLWLANIVLVMIAVTTLTTLSDALASDIAQRTFSVTMLTAYAVTIDLGAAVGPLFSYLTIMLKNGLFYAYAAGALILVLLALVWGRMPGNLTEQNKKASL